MRRGIGLRGYAQQDPLNEFRKEAFRLYEELSDLIRRQVATTIFRVSVRRESETVPLSGPGQPARPVGDGSNGSGTNGASGGGAVAAGVAAVAAASTAAGAAARGPIGAGQAAMRQPGMTGAGPISGLPSDPMKSAREVPGDAAAASGTRPGFTPSGARIGRNDPCWCGSGQKYKRCHGA